MNKAEILNQEIDKYELENEKFDRTQFDRVQVLEVVFRSMDLYAVELNEKILDRCIDLLAKHEPDVLRDRIEIIKNL